jgi:hypothetical protein
MEHQQGGGWHAHIGRYEDGREFGAVLHILPLGGGEVRDSEYWGGAWSGVEGAESALVLVKCWHGEAAAEAIPRLLAEMTSLPTDYDELLARHRAEHEPLTNAFTLDLKADETERVQSNDALIQTAFEGTVSLRLSSAWSHINAIC